MTHKAGRIGRVLAIAMVGGLIATTASAAPLGPSHISVDYAGGGLVIIDVFGGGQGSGSDHYAHGGQWDPLLLANVDGTIDNQASFGGETADTGDDYTRYWVSTSNTATPRRWTVPSSTVPPSNNETPGGLPVPEPGSLMLLGSGLIGLATSARRFWRPKAR